MFSIIISILNTTGLLYIASHNLFGFFGIPEYISLSILTGFIEVTNGISFVSNISYISTNLKIIICSFILGFGGFSVLLQVLSITSKANISIKPYFLGKLLQAILAAIYTYIFLCF